MPAVSQRLLAMACMLFSFPLAGETAVARSEEVSAEKGVCIHHRNRNHIDAIHIHTCTCIYTATYPTRNLVEMLRWMFAPISCVVHAAPRMYCGFAAHTRTRTLAHMHAGDDALKYYHTCAAAVLVLDGAQAPNTIARTHTRTPSEGHDPVRAQIACTLCTRD